MRAPPFGKLHAPGPAPALPKALRVAVLLGLVLILLQPNPAAAQDGAVERLHRFLAETRTLSADFRQRLLDEEGRLVEEAAGKVSLARPGDSVGPTKNRTHSRSSAMESRCGSTIPISTRLR